MNYSKKHLEELIVKHFDGCLDVQAENELASLLSESEEASKLFTSYMRIEGAAMQLGKADCISMKSKELVPSGILPVSAVHTVCARPGTKSRKIRYVFAAVILAAISLWIFLSIQKVSTPGPALASISRIVNPTWRDSNVPLEVGAGLRAGSIELESGLLQIDFVSGATVVLEGPVEFDIISAMHCSCRSGRLRTHVPPQAYGFTIDSPEAMIVDLGTEFGLQVDDSGNTEVHVFDGAVELHDVSYDSGIAEKQLLNAGNAIQIAAASGRRNPIPVDNQGFVGPSMLVNLSRIYSVDLKKRLKELQKKEAGLTRELKTYLETEIYGKQLSDLKKRVDNAKLALFEYENANPKIVKARKLLQDTISGLNRLIRKKLYASGEGSRLINRQKNLESKFLKLKKKKKSLTGSRSRQEVKKINRGIDLVLKDKWETVKRLRVLRNRFQKTDPQVKAVKKKITAARKAFAKVAGKKYDNLKKSAKKAQQNYQSEKKKLLKENETVRSLRAEKTVLSLRIRDLKLKIRNLKKDNKA